jgi:probable HAF family extracellular repeat protein
VSNNVGQVVGFSNPGNGVTGQAAIWNGTTPTVLGAPSGSFSAAQGINDTGQIVGDINNQAVLWNGTTPTYLDTVGGATSSSATGINNTGQVVGWGVTSSYNGYAMLWNGTTPTILGTLGGQTTQAYAINNNGEVVGAGSPSTPPNSFHAIVWNGTTAIDLNNLVDLPSGYTLVLAKALNNAGQIVGYYIDGSGLGAFLLTPVPLPVTLACPAATAQVGASYSSALTAAGGIPPYSFSNTGNLPGGLTLNTTTGAVTGTPSTAGPFSFTAKVVDSSGLAAGTVAASCTITVSPAPNFSISALPASLSIVQGSAGTSSINTKVLYGFAGSIKFQQSGAPTGTSVTFMPPSVSAGSSSTMQITVGSSTAVGTYPVTATGTSGALSHTTSASLTVTPVPLQLSVTPSSLEFGTVRRFSLRFKTVTLKNTGTGTVLLSRVSVTPGPKTDRHDLTPISLCGPTLDTGRSCEIIVVLFADQLGSLSATLNIPNDAVTSPQSVALSATVIKDWW